MAVGTKVVIHLKDKEKGNFGNKFNLERLIKKYSNFVGFPISIDGERANKIEALWAQPASQVTQDQHNEFYRFIANAFDTPRYQFQFAADAPLSIQCLLYVPQVRKLKAAKLYFSHGATHQPLYAESRFTVLTEELMC